MPRTCNKFVVLLFCDLRGNQYIFIVQKYQGFNKHFTTSVIPFTLEVRARLNGRQCLKSPPGQNEASKKTDAKGVTENAPSVEDRLFQTG